MLRELKNNAHRIIGLDIVKEKDTMFLQTEKEVIESVQIQNLRYNDRYSNGSFIIDETVNGSVTEIWKELSSNSEEDFNKK